MTKRELIVMITVGFLWLVLLCGGGLLTNSWFDEGGLWQNVTSITVPIFVMVAVFPSFIFAVTKFGGKPNN